jgi:hypothetical protein
VGFVARNVGRSLQSQGLAHVLPIALPMELPPLGIIRLTVAKPGPTAQQLTEALRQVAWDWPTGQA